MSWRVVALVGIAACVPQVTYEPRGPQVERPSRPASTVEVLRRIPPHCTAQEIGYIEIQCRGRYLQRMRAIAAEDGADAITALDERDFRSSPHLPRDGNICSAVAVVLRCDARPRRATAE